MAKIVITVREAGPSAAFVAGLRVITHSSLSDVRSALADGNPVFEEELFLNNHQEIAEKIRDMELLAQENNIALNYYELQPGEDFSTCIRDECSINYGIIQNILKAWDES